MKIKIKKFIVKILFNDSDRYTIVRALQERSNKYDIDRETRYEVIDLLNIFKTDWWK